MVKTKLAPKDFKIEKSVSLKDLLKDDTEIVFDPENLPKTDFSSETLLSLWSNYAYSIKGSDLDFFSTLNSCQPTLIDGYQIEITLTNTFQISEFTKTKQVLLDYLRKSLNNYSVNIIEILNEKEVKSIAVTPNDKYKKLVEKNILLDEFRKKLDLGF